MADDKNLEMVAVDKSPSSKEGSVEVVAKSNSDGAAPKTVLEVCPMTRIGRAKAPGAQICADGWNRDTSTRPPSSISDSLYRRRGKLLVLPFNSVY